MQAKKIFLNTKSSTTYNLSNWLLLQIYSIKTPPVYTAEINQQRKQGAHGLRMAEPPGNLKILSCKTRRAQ